MDKTFSDEIYPCDAVCPRCSKTFVRNSADENYCSAECEFELPCHTRRKVKGRRKALSLEEVVKRLERYRKRTGRCISYGEFVKIGGGNINDKKQT